MNRCDDENASCYCARDGHACDLQCEAGEPVVTIALTIAVDWPDGDGADVQFDLVASVETDP